MLSGLNQLSQSHRRHLIGIWAVHANQSESLITCEEVKFEFVIAYPGRLLAARQVFFFSFGPHNRGRFLPFLSVIEAPRP